jgi:hypothetical protein
VGLGNPRLKREQNRARAARPPEGTLVMPPRLRLLAAATVLIVAGGTAAVASAASDQPVELCGRYQTSPVKHSRYIVMNNVWGATTQQCLELASDGAFRVRRTSHRNTDAAAAYPSIYAGCHWGACTRGTPLPLPVDEIRSARSTWHADTGAPGVWNATYDLWFHTTADVNRSPDGAEVMIWLDRSGGANPSGTVVARNVRLAGAVWDVWHEDSAWNYVAYVRTSPTSSVRNLDLRAFTLDAVSRGYVHRSWYLSGVEAGFEIWRDGAGLASRSFSVTVARGGSPLSRASTAPAALPSRRPACAVRWTTNVWSSGLLTSVIVTNAGPPAPEWTVSWAFADDQRIGTDWGVQTTQSGRRVVARSAAYNRRLPGGATVTFGFQASHGGAPRAPTDVRLNGVPCAMVD